MIKLKKIIDQIGNKENFTFVSVGTNDGFFVEEMFLSDLLNIKWDCYFIEPVKKSYESLIKNYNSHYPNNKFTYENYAIHINEGEDFLVTNKVDDSMGMCSFFRGDGENEDSVKIKVNKKKFKSFILNNDITKIDFLKIDCEGMDYEIILQCFDNEIYPDLILYEEISMPYEIKDVRTLRDLTEWVLNQNEYVIISDIPEHQYEDANKLLIKKELLQYV
jgi:FkbM family methyltransferase